MWGAVGQHRSSVRTMLSATRPEGQAAEWKSRGQSQARSGLRCAHCLGPPLLRLSPITAGARRSSSTGSNGAQSQYRPRTGSRWPPYAGSLKESSDAPPSRRTGTRSGETDVMAHRIHGHKIGSKLRRCHIQDRCSCVTSDVKQLDSAMRQEREERQLPVSSTTPSYFSDLFLYFLFLFSHRERWDNVWEDVGCAKVTSHFIRPAV
jgi:hypothetical protein